MHGVIIVILESAKTYLASALLQSGNLCYMYFKQQLCC